MQWQLNQSQELVEAYKEQLACSGARRLHALSSLVTQVVRSALGGLSGGLRLRQR